MKKRSMPWLILILTFILPVCAACAAGFAGDPDAIERAAQSVLMLEVYDSGNKMIATGSGFVAFDGQTLVTNYHVIEDSVSVIAYGDDGKRYEVENVLVASEGKDIAILRFAGESGLAPLALNTAQNQRRGEPVVAIGSPIGIKNTVSLGNISAIYDEDNVSYIQFTAPISSGSSGGALFNDAGEVIGMTSAGYDDAQNINLAIHSGEITALYSQWDGAETAIGTYLGTSREAAADGSWYSRLHPGAAEAAAGSVSLIIPDDAYGEWEEADGDVLSMRLEVENTAGQAVCAFELYAYTYDQDGDALLAEDEVWSVEMEREIAPGERVYTDWFDLERASDIYAVYVGVYQVLYADGTSETAYEEDMEYAYWTLD